MVFCAMGNHGLLKWLPDRLYLQILFKIRTGLKLNLKNPVGFCEKLQWIKLYLHDPIYPIIVDKYSVRDYVRKKIGSEYLVPLLGVWNKVNDIDFEKLPEQFVLKCTHDSGSVSICKNKANFNIDLTKKKLKKRLKRNTYWATREWPYRLVTPRIIAEKYMVDESGYELKDYKVLCFNGIPKLIELHSGRFTKNHTQDFYDTEWNLTNIKQIGHNVSLKPLSKPKQLDRIIELSSVLSKDIPHVRVDWYSIGEKIYFGELTLFDSAGFELFEDSNIERMIGDWINLPDHPIK